MASVLYFQRVHGHLSHDVHVLPNSQATGLKGSVETLLDEADTDGDGRISLPEFQKLLHQASFGSRTNTDHNQPRK